MSQPVSRRLHLLSTLARAGSLHLCSCRAARLGSGAPALPVSRVLAGLRLVDPPWISCSVGERAPHRYLRLSTKPAAGPGSCVNPREEGGESIPGTWTLPLGTCSGLVRASDESRGAVGGASSGLTTAEVDSSAGRSFVKGTKTGCEFFSKCCLFVVRLVSVKKWKARPGFRVRKTCDCQDVSHDLQLHPGQARVRARP